MALTWLTPNEGVPSHGPRTGAHWIVVNHFTNSINSTGARARVFTQLVDTCQVLRALRVNDTLGSALLVRVSKVAFLADTHKTGFLDPTLSICAAGSFGTWAVFLLEWSQGAGPG